MLEFILSKMNLLILVMAMVAIIGFFTFGLVDITKVSEAGKLVSKIKETSFAFASSPSYCFSDAYILPDEIEVAGSSFYYVMRISKRVIEPEDGGPPINVLIFSMYPRDEMKKAMTEDYEPKAIAASSFRTKAEIHLWSKTYFDSGNGLSYEGDYEEHMDEDIFIDPQAVTPANAIEFVKEVEDGQPKLYVTVCGTSVLCSVAKEYVGLEIHPGAGFGC